MLPHSIETLIETLCVCCSPLGQRVGRLGADVRTVFVRALRAVDGRMGAVTANLLRATMAAMTAEGAINVPNNMESTPLGE